jgi:hypothetical protein
MLQEGSLAKDQKRKKKKKKKKNKKKKRKKKKEKKKRTFNLVRIGGSLYTSNFYNFSQINNSSLIRDYKASFSLEKLKPSQTISLSSCAVTFFPNRFSLFFFFFVIFNTLLYILEKLISG